MTNGKTNIILFYNIIRKCAMRKILIFTVTAGNGHNIIAKTIRDCLYKEYENEVDVKIVDMYLDYPGKFKSWLVDDGYKLSVKYALPIYNATFKKLQAEKPATKNPAFVNYMIAGKHKNLMESIQKYKPDAIFCTHFYPAIVLSELKEKGLLKIPVATMETDFAYTPYFECCTKVDKIFIPAEEYVQNFLNIGYKESQIEVLGFPSKIDAENLPRDKDKRLTLLIMSGAGAFMGLTTQVHHLLKADLDVNIILINGKDEQKYKMYRRLIYKLKKNRKLKHTKVEVYGFVSDEKQLELLKRADCIVSKAGANSAIETINLSKVLITTKNLAEQELSNVRYIKKYADCFLLDKPTDLRDLVASNIFNHTYFENYIKNIKVLHKDNVNESYTKAIMELCELNKKA